MKKQILNISDVGLEKIIRITRNNHIFFCIVRESSKQDTEKIKRVPNVIGLKEGVDIYTIKLEIVCPFIEMASLSRYPSHGMNIMNDGSFFSFNVYKETDDFFFSLSDRKCEFRIFESGDSEVLKVFEDKIKTETEGNIEEVERKNIVITEKYTRHSNSFAKKRKIHD